MTRYEIIPATLEHVEEIAPRLREADVQEVYAASHLDPLTALRRSLVVSRNPKIGTADGLACCIFGVAAPSVLSETGVPWLLATPEITQHARAFLRMSHDYVASMRADYEVLRNMVDARNKDAIKWLRWLGFRIDPAIPFGPDKMPFHPFEMRRHV